MTPWTLTCQIPCPWHFPGKNTGVGCHFLSKGSSQCRGQTWISFTGRQILHHWTPGKLHKTNYEAWISSSVRWNDAIDVSHVSVKCLTSETANQGPWASEVCRDSLWTLPHHEKLIFSHKILSPMRTQNVHKNPFVASVYLEWGDTFNISPTFPDHSL